MWLRTSCDLAFEIESPTPFVLMLRPRSGAQQWIAREEYRLVPSVPVFEFTDGYGNLCQRLIAPSGTFEIYTNAEVMTSDHIDHAFGAPFVEIQNLPDAVLSYLLPSRYCESERFHQMASEITVDQRPGYDQVAAIAVWLRDNIRFSPGSSDSAVSAVEVNSRQVGVCRDLAHLGIALCRTKPWGSGLAFCLVNPKPRLIIPVFRFGLPPADRVWSPDGTSRRIVKVKGK